VSCGALVVQEATFAGYTIPARMRIGCDFGTERFASEESFSDSVSMLRLIDTCEPDSE
jgi:hypothetical protein